MPDLTRSDHLPNRRPGGVPPHPSWLPRQRRGTTPQMIGRYPDYDVLDTVNTWDAATKKWCWPGWTQSARCAFSPG